MYNGSLYYHQQEEARVIRYELAAERNTMVNLPNATVTGNIYLYGHVSTSMIKLLLKGKRKHERGENLRNL